MKKHLFSLVLVSGLFLGACSNNQETASSETKENTESSIVVSESSDAIIEEDEPVVDLATLNEIATDIGSKFNDDGDDKTVEVEVITNVADDTSSEPHSVIEIRVIDDEARKVMEEFQAAIDSNTATEEQLIAIYGIQLNVEEAAKDLPNDFDLIKFVNPESNGNNRVLALSSRIENIIPLVQ